MKNHNNDVAGIMDNFVPEFQDYVNKEEDELAKMDFEIKQAELELQLKKNGIQKNGSSKINGSKKKAVRKAKEPKGTAGAEVGSDINGSPVVKKERQPRAKTPAGPK